MLSKVRKRLKVYNKITNFSEIARRYFINNFYDGALTVLGIILGFFVLVLKDPTQHTVPSIYITLPGIGTSLSMFISGISGSYLSEKAELRKKRADIDKAMGITESEPIIDEPEIIQQQEEEIKKAMISKIKLKINKNDVKNKTSRKTIYDKAQSFAGKFVAAVNGLAPLLGGLIPLIPFTTVSDADFMIFIISFIVILMCIILLGTYLGQISNESIIKNILQMLFAFIATMIIVVIILG
ncbi:MAG: VIT1/CCC1 transporter family protein [Promethearchaeota archaeon]